MGAPIHGRAGSSCDGGATLRRMGGMTRLFVLALAAALLGAAGAAGSTPGARRDFAPRCKGSQFAGSFSGVRGSAGAGNISYALVLRNRSTSACTLTGLPSARLLGKSGKPLPTIVKPAFPGALAAVLVTLEPGQSSRATARFSPDVPGPGEPTQGTRCEPVAYTLRVNAQGGGTATAPIRPPTPVCEHGRLLFSAYGIRA